MTAPDRRTTTWARFVGAFAALGIVLCTSLMLAGPSALSPASSSATAPGVAMAMPAPATGPVGAIGSDSASSLGCENACAAEATVACATAVAMGLALLVLVGLRRSRHRALAPRQSLGLVRLTALREQPPWSVLSPMRLCVLRV